MSENGQTLARRYVETRREWTEASDDLRAATNRLSSVSDALAGLENELGKGRPELFPKVFIVDGDAVVVTKVEERVYVSVRSIERG